ncbi:MAG: hypothetical protein GY775_12595, partial [Candidatus Scalindua sp.]|nr:hypothetical protein [Candidatus Scalindua sp.]
RVKGDVKVVVNIGFVYDAVYYSGGDFDQSFAQVGSDVTSIKARQEITTWKRSQSTITVFPELDLEQEGGIGTIAAGWTVSAHHNWLPYYPDTLYMGDGTNKEYGKIITTVVGNGQGGYSGDSGLAVDAEIKYPRDLTLDSSGNLYIADTGNNVIRKVDTNGVITTVAGTGVAGYNGDNIYAIDAELNLPYSVTVDNDGNIYIADTSNRRVRKVDTDGIITTIAGNGEPFGDIGDGGPATEARLGLVKDVATDNAGNIYICDSLNWSVRKIDTSGIITTVAGDGTRGDTGGDNGDGGPAIEAQFYFPYSIAVDDLGNIFISESEIKVRKVGTNGIITTVAGNGERGYSEDGGAATESELQFLGGIAIDNIGNLYISDYYSSSSRIRKVDTNGIITTVIGNGQRGYSGDGGPPTEAVTGLLGGMAADSTGDIWFCDSENNRIRKVSIPGIFTGPVLAGEKAFTDENGLGYIVDESTGLHKSTIDLSTGKTLLTFGYNVDSQLETITDRFNNQTTLQRGPSGVPISITSPDGIVTGLTVDANNHLTQVTLPDTTSFSFTYDPNGGGLMTDEYDQNNNHFVHVFDGGGKVTDVDDPEGGTWDYERTVDSEGNVTTKVLTGEGNLTTYVDRTESTGAFTSTKTGPDGSISTVSRESDGITETHELSCGMTLERKYDIDSEYAYEYLKDSTQSTPSGLERL